MHCKPHMLSSAIPNVNLGCKAGLLCKCRAAWETVALSRLCSAFIDVASDVLNILCANDMLNMWLC